MATPSTTSSGQKPRVVILGAGFAGLTAAFELKNAPIDVILVDRTNHHLFQPMLYQVATAALSPADISGATRNIVRKHKNTQVVLGDVKSVDPARKVVVLDTLEKHGDEIAYDYLLIGLGTRHSYFGKDEWERFAPGLKTLSDALSIRRRFLLAFEKAEEAEDPAERKAFMTFVIVGGGPTGCELAGVLPEIAKKAMHEDFRHIDTSETRVILIEAGQRVLAAFPEDLANRAKRDLEKLGVEVRTSARVTNIDDNGVTLDGEEHIAARTVIWAAGNTASPVARSLGVPLDRAGRVLVNPDLSIPGHPEIFVAGDLAAVKQIDGSFVPGVAQGGIQGGRQAARNILHLLYRERTHPFHYWNKGDLAVIGRNKAVANLHVGKKDIHLHGFFAWLIWLFIHILYLIGFRNKISVLMQWAWAYVTYQRGSRIIGEPEKLLEQPAPVPPVATL